MRLGRLIDGGTKGPGLFFIMPCIDTFRIVRLIYITEFILLLMLHSSFLDILNFKKNFFFVKIKSFFRDCSLRIKMRSAVDSLPPPGRLIFNLLQAEQLEFHPASQFPRYQWPAEVPVEVLVTGPQIFDFSH